MSKPFASVIMATYRRGHMIGRALEALTKQTCKNFEVVVVLKPSGDNTEQVVGSYSDKLNIHLLHFNRQDGCVTDQLNLGMKKVQGKIILFLDDDALAFADWMQSHLETYSGENVGGVAGNVIPAYLNGEQVVEIQDKTSEIIQNYSCFMEGVGKKIWSRPLDGQEGYLVYISKAGIVDYNLDVAKRSNSQITKSLLGMGANMSVLAEPLKDFSFPSWTYGVAWEQYLGWYLWKKGYNLLFNPQAKVHHLSHGQTLSRNITDHKKLVMRQVESQLLFYRLYGLEPGLSLMHRVSWLIFNTSLKLKQAQNMREVTDLFKGMFIGNFGSMPKQIQKNLVFRQKLKVT